MDTYEFIIAKINQLKEKYPSLRARTDDYVFSVLCFKNHFYKNPELVLNEDDFAEFVVDGSRDGGRNSMRNENLHYQHYELRMAVLRRRLENSFRLLHVCAKEKN